MESAERILRTLNHQEPDRVPVHDQFWPSTIERWYREGLPTNIATAEYFGKEPHQGAWRGSPTSPTDYFGLEMVYISADISPRFATDVVDEDDQHVLEHTPYGALRRQLRTRASVPEVLDWPIRSRDDWNRIKSRLQPDPTRVDWEAVEAAYAAARRKGKFVAFYAHVGWAQFQEYIKNDELLMLMATEPEWVKEMFQIHAELVVGLAEIMIDRGIRFDGARLGCDLGYRNATFISPQMYRALQFPADRMVFRFFRDKGMPVILHSDGRVKALIPQFIEAGISALNPIESKAGMDLIELKRVYGHDLAFMGGIDVRAMADPDPLVIEDEIRRKFEVAMVDGGYIYHSDHSVPDNVSLSQYCRVLDLVRRYGVYR